MAFPPGFFAFLRGGVWQAITKSLLMRPLEWFLGCGHMFGFSPLPSVGGNCEHTHTHLLKLLQQAGPSDRDGEVYMMYHKQRFLKCVVGEIGQVVRKVEQHTESIFLWRRNQGTKCHIASCVHLSTSTCVRNYCIPEALQTYSSGLGKLSKHNYTS